MSDSSYLERLFKASTAEHLLKRGMLLRIYYDLETTDLNRYFSAPTEYAMVLTDVKGRTHAELALNVRVPRHVVPSPQACLVTQTFPQEMYSQDRELPHIAAGKVVEFLRTAHRKLWDAQKDEETTLEKPNGETETIRLFRIPGEDGGEHIFRLHDKGKWISFQSDTNAPDGARHYRDADGTRWRKILTPSITAGHNNISADDPWIWTALFMSGHRDLFQTHVKKYGHQRLDTLKISKVAYLRNRQGENGFQAGRIGNRLSFSQGKLMEANTRDAEPERGLTEGIRMPDGTLHDPLRDHKGIIDARALASLDAYIRHCDPELMAHFEEVGQSLDATKSFLMGRQGFEPRPVLGFMRDTYPGGPRFQFGVCAAIDEEVEERRLAVLIRTDTQERLEDYTYGGKRLLQMNVNDLTAMMRAQRRRSDALFEIIHLRKCAPVLPADMAGERDHEHNEANRRFVLENDDFREKLVEALWQVSPLPPGAESLPNPQPEEEIFTSMGEAKFYDISLPNGGTVETPEDVQAHVRDALTHERNIDATMRRAIEPDPIEWRQDFATLAEFVKKMKKVEKDLQLYLRADKADGPILLQPEVPYALKGDPDTIDPEIVQTACTNAVEHLWKMREDLMYRFNDTSRAWRIEDEKHHEIPLHVLALMHPQTRQARLSSGEYTVQFEHLNHTSEIIAGMFYESGRVEELKTRLTAEVALGSPEAVDELKIWQDWDEYFAARQTMRTKGPDNPAPGWFRWMHARAGLQEIERIRTNAARGSEMRADEDEQGLWDIFVAAGDKAEPILEACATLYRQMLRDALPESVWMPVMGFDPERGGMAIEKPKYGVEEPWQMPIFDVPDRMLDQPLSNLRAGATLMMLDPIPGLKEAIVKDQSLLLRGAESGRVFLGVKPAIEHQVTPEPYYAELYINAQKQYVDSGVPFPGREKLICVAFQEIAPLEGLRPVNHALQTIKMPRWEDFMATVSPVMGLREEKQTGVFLPHIDFTPKPGRARLQGMIAEDKGKLVESGWEVEAEITDVKTISWKDLRDTLRRSRLSIQIAADLGFKNVATMRAALVRGSIPHADCERVGFLDTMALRTALQGPVFRELDARRFGYGGLLDMETKLAQLFSRKTSDRNRADNLVHFVSFAEVDKTTMNYFKPAGRSIAKHLPSTLPSLSY